MYTPPRHILETYADILVNFALGSGEGIRPGETVYVSVPESAKPFYAPLRNAIIKAGGNAIMFFTPDGVDFPSALALMSDQQLDFFPSAFYRGLVDQIDHSIAIIAEYDKYELAGVDPQRLMRRQLALKPYREWRDEKENQGKFTWTLALYGTPAMAKEVGMSEEEYWEQIVHACFLDDANPIERWRGIAQELERVRAELNALAIDSVRITGPDVDLTIGIGEKRQWLGGSGRNIPSFELFTSPDKRRADGWIRFNQPLYTHGQRVSGISLSFKNGSISEAHAEENEHLLKEMIATDGADRLGEFSLTDSRMSRITKPMGETLYDENMGGAEGNTHIAIGNAYKDAYAGDPSTPSAEEWDRLGYNESVVHTDIISTAPRTVTATLVDGSTKVIYDKGMFTI